MTLQQTFNELTGQNQTMVQDGEYTAETVNEPRERLTKDTTLKLSQIKREEVADKRYKPGEISEKTGLQKQPDGSWAEPRNKEIGKTGNFEKKQQEAKKAKAAEALKPAASKKAENIAGNYEAILKKAKPEQRKVIEAVEEDMQMVSEDDLDKSSYKKLNDAYGQFMETGDLGKLKEAATILQQASGRKYNTASLPSAAAKKTPAAKKTGADLSKVTHFDLDMARNAMNTTPAEDQQLDYFITEMHEDGTSLENIIKRQDGIYERSEGRYPKEEAVYKSLREKIMKHYGAR